MKLNFEFNGWEEFKEFILQVTSDAGSIETELLKRALAEEPAKEPATATQDSPQPVKKEKTENDTPEEEKPVNEAPAETQEDAGDAIDLEDLKKEARALLAEANKKTKKRVSLEWTEELAGVGKKLKDIEDADIIMELIRRAKEVVG